MDVFRVTFQNYDGLKLQNLEIFFSKFCVFLGKTTPYDKIFKIMFQKFTGRHPLTLLRWNVVKFVRREIAEIVRYLPNKKQFRLPFKLSLLRR